MRAEPQGAQASGLHLLRAGVGLETVDVGLHLASEGFVVVQRAGADKGGAGLGLAAQNQRKAALASGGRFPAGHPVRSRGGRIACLGRCPGADWCCGLKRCARHARGPTGKHLFSISRSQRLPFPIFGDESVYQDGASSDDGCCCDLERLPVGSEPFIEGRDALVGMDGSDGRHVKRVAHARPAAANAALSAQGPER